MMKHPLLVILLLGWMLTANAQVEERFKTQPKDSTAQQPPADTTANTRFTEERKVPVENFWDRIVVGGNLSLLFGTYTAVYLAPSVGYKFTDNIVAGPGFIYQYVRVKGFTQGNQRYEAYENTVYGPKVFGNYIVADRFYGGLQFEYLNHDVPYINTATVMPSLTFENKWTPVLFLEAGIATRMGENGFAQIGLRYNLLHGPDSPYNSAFFPVIGFFF